ncbi:MAG: tetratricopeptide repeat protein [Acidobacteriota bacterium]
MITKTAKFLGVIAVFAGFGLQQSWAGEHRIAISIPLRSRTSPVQRLNREGVREVKKNHYEKAERLFYKAYLYDPADPFTLNNLGYVAELQGQIQQAHRYYQLATEQGSSAPIAMSSLDSLDGKPMTAAYATIEDLPMRINRMNLDAMNLLTQQRGFEAEGLLQDALKLDPRNPFTLNNLAVADEAIGDYEDALKNYTTAADLHSSEKVTVTADHAWRGKSISDMAAEGAKNLKKRVAGMPPQELAAIRYNIRGVHEENENQWAAARQDFLRAYQADPNDAFSLNNRAYVAARDGDLETAQFYYDKARRAQDADARVGLATQATAQGQSLLTVASDSTGSVDRALSVYEQQRRQQQGPVELTPRGAGLSQQAKPQAPNSTSGAPSGTAPQNSR